MDTARCRAFVAAARTGSFTKAAEELNYTPSGVSQLVSALEEDLKLNLLSRSRRGVSLTADGERMYNTIYNFLRQEDQIYDKAADITGLVTGEISIAAYPSICAAWLPKIISRFRELYPGVVFKLDDSIRRNVVDTINSGHADVGFLSNLHDISGEWIQLQRNPMIALVSWDSPYAKWDAFPLKECEVAPIIQHSFGYDLDLQDILNRNKIKLNVVYTTRNSSTAAAMAANNMGVVLVNELSTHMWNFNLKIMPLDPPQYVNMGMVVGSHMTASPAVREFVRFVRESFQGKMSGE